ncbi:MAG TPA: NADH-quinone oxidoreductase subunit NuoE [Candidatus Krumholzibacteria bacterium]|nr:NADH-quinone oxidoreductase subunit NuoE [Candidatus Krumholzibacteria bacterium]HPD70187.1 NADH-quinone oxidoreductase subunit NuoE [Candidatus Krumholzibacteria bacterium]HRY40113.1 NADH-quinone oxidoreductase subunit NuoE [Candidatus Krumholzibacteria bacterium]
MDANTSQLLELIRPFKGQTGATIPVLQAIQTNVGYLPPESFALIEQEMGIPASKAYGVATFYAQFRTTPVGKHLIKVCDGTACHVKGAVNILTAIRDYLHLADADTTEDRVFTVQVVACLGCCSLAPVMMVGETTYGSLSLEKTREILDSYRAGEV